MQGKAEQQHVRRLVTASKVKPHLAGTLPKHSCTRQLRYVGIHHSGQPSALRELLEDVQVRLFAAVAKSALVNMSTSGVAYDTDSLNPRHCHLMGSGVTHAAPLPAYGTLSYMAPRPQVDLIAVPVIVRLVFRDAIAAVLFRWRAGVGKRCEGPIGTAVVHPDPQPQEQHQNGECYYRGWVPQLCCGGRISCTCGRTS